MLLDVALPSFPVGAARNVEKHRRNRLRLARLEQRQDLVRLVVGSKTARKENGRFGLFHEEKLAGEKVSEGNELGIAGDDGVRLLLERQRDVDAEAPLASGAALASIHDPT